MKHSTIIFNKGLITLSSLFFLIVIAIYPMFSFVNQFKYNIAIFMVLLANQNQVENSTLLNILLNNHVYVNCFLAVVIIILQLTYLIPLWTFKKQFSIAMLNLYQLIINILLVVILCFFFNCFGFRYFSWVSINGLLIIPFILIALNFSIIFNFAILHLATVNITVTKNATISSTNMTQEQVIIETPNVETLTSEELANKINELKTFLNNSNFKSN